MHILQSPPPLELLRITATPTIQRAHPLVPDPTAPSMWLACFSIHAIQLPIIEFNSSADDATLLSSPVLTPTLGGEANSCAVDASYPTSSVIEENRLAALETQPLSSTVPLTTCGANSTVNSIYPNNAFYITLQLHSIGDTPVYIHSGSSLSDYNKIGTIPPWGLVHLNALPPNCSHQDYYTLHNKQGFIASMLAPGQKWLFHHHHTPSVLYSEELTLQVLNCPSSCDTPTVLAWWLDNLEFVVNKIFFEGWRYHPLDIEYWLGLRSPSIEIIVDDYFDRCGPRIEEIRAAIIPSNFHSYGRLGDAFLCIAHAFLLELSHYLQEICQCRTDGIPLTNCIVMSMAHCLPITHPHTAPTPLPPLYQDDDTVSSQFSSKNTHSDYASSWDSYESSGESSGEESEDSPCQWMHLDNMQMINEWRPPPTPPANPPPTTARFPPLQNSLSTPRIYNRRHERLYYARMQSLKQYKKEFLRGAKHLPSPHASSYDPCIILHNDTRDRSLIPTTEYLGPRRRPPPTATAPSLRTPSDTPPSPKPATPITPLTPASTSYQRATATVNALMRHLPLIKPIPCIRGYRPHRAHTDVFPSYTTLTLPAPSRQHYTTQHAGSLPILVHDTPVLLRIPPTMPSCATMLFPPDCARIPTPRLPVSLHPSVTRHKSIIHPSSLSANTSSSTISLALHCFFAMSLTLLLPSIYSLLYDTRVAPLTLFPLPQPSFFPLCSCAQTPAHNLSAPMLPSTGIG